jgi:hypothetical protein
MLRRCLALATFVALTLLAIDPILIKWGLFQRAKVHQLLTNSPDRGWGDYPKFLDDVRAHTQPGDSIALVVPTLRWDGGYSYAFYRASYFLTGREVLPIVTDRDAAIPENFARAKYVAAWRRNVRDATRHVVWTGDGGALLEH